MSRRFAQVKAVVFQINGFQEVITRHMRKDYTVSKPMDGGIRMGAKTLPYYGDENDYGSDGKLPYYWGDVQGETIKEYLERNQ